MEHAQCQTCVNVKQLDDHMCFPSSHTPAGHTNARTTKNMEWAVSQHKCHVCVLQADRVQFNSSTMKMIANIGTYTMDIQIPIHICN